VYLFEGLTLVLRTFCVNSWIVLVEARKRETKLRGHRLPASDTLFLKAISRLIARYYFQQISLNNCRPASVVVLVLLRPYSADNISLSGES
jgi:hypothetical protein